MDHRRLGGVVTVGVEMIGQTRWLAAVILVLATIDVMAAISVRPSVGVDPAVGFLVQRSMNRGAAWNHLIEPSDVDLALDTSSFVSAWSPGQYAVPGALVSAGLSIGQASTTVGILASLVGIAGWAWLFHVLGFSPVVTLASCLFLMLARSFGLGFFVYPGSDLLAFAAFPVMAAAMFRWRDRLGLIWLAPALVVAAFLLRNFLAVVVAIWFLAGVLTQTIDRGFSRRTILVSACAGLLVLAAIVAIQFEYNARGWTLLAGQAEARHLADVLLPWAMPLLAVTSSDDLLAWMFLHPDRAWFDYRQSVPFLTAVAAVGVLLAIVEIRRSSDRSPATHAIAFVAGLSAVYTGLLSSGSMMNLAAGRHYVLAGAVLLPFLLRRVFAWPAKARMAAIVLLCVPCLYGQVAVGVNWRRHFAKRDTASQQVQVAHLQLTPRVAQAMQHLDQNLPGHASLVVVPLPTYALEFQRSRVLALNISSREPSKVTGQQRRGRVENLVVMSELGGMSAAAVDDLLASFVSYDSTQWQSVDIDGYRFHVPTQQPVDRAWLREHLDADRSPWQP